ncbi:unnamed protein product [Toxocara canis]|uniref:Uncharacterized protein n=1 Tax=Toxocara canis TaxID=6265 RepID=A0A183UE64_TOXCA|nr:unnamed protein product [Toxocara canis]
MGVGPNEGEGPVIGQQNRAAQHYVVGNGRELCRQATRVRRRAVDAPVLTRHMLKQSVARCVGSFLRSLSFPSRFLCFGAKPAARETTPVLAVNHSESEAVTLHLFALLVCELYVV